MLRCSLWALAAAVQPKARLIADKVGDWLREIFAEPIKLPPGVSELVVISLIRSIRPRMRAVAASIVPGATARAGLRSSLSTWAVSKRRMRWFLSIRAKCT